MKIHDVIQCLELFAPLTYQEMYDNSGLQTGNKNTECNGVLLCIDITEKIIDEAIDKKANLIISHHPVIFQGIKKLTGANYIERVLIKAITHNIAIYCCHTNLDNIINGVNAQIAKKINLTNLKILAPKSNELQKLVVFVPVSHAEKVRNALFSVGAGTIGDYDQCSFNIEGIGTFRASYKANPYVGKIGKRHSETEIRIETIFPKHLQQQIISSIYQYHPYEEPAFDIYSLKNNFDTIGLGLIGSFKKNITVNAFLQMVKKNFNVSIIRHSEIISNSIKKVAICGGSGREVLQEAIHSKADVFITGELKYHDYFNTNQSILLVEIGHYESEQYTKDLIYDILKKNFPKLAVSLTEINTNPIKYF